AAAGVCEQISAMSGLLLFAALIPQDALAATKPSGAVTPPRISEKDVGIYLMREKKKQQSRDENQRRNPPKPAQSARLDFAAAAAEFLLDKFVVIEVLLRQIKPIVNRVFRPSG